MSLDVNAPRDLISEVDRVGAVCVGAQRRPLPEGRQLRRDVSRCIKLQAASILEINRFA